eukprot:151442_1
MHCMATPFKRIDSKASLNSIHRLLSLPQRGAFVLSWQHIANALSHELYDEISSSFMVTVNGSKRFENMDELLQEIKNKRHIHQNEVDYIRELIERARQFQQNVLPAKHANKDQIEPQSVFTLCAMIKQVKLNQYAHVPQTEHHQAGVVDMDDILRIICGNDDIMMTVHVLQFIVDHQYDADAIVHDLNMAAMDECIRNHIEWNRLIAVPNIPFFAVNTFYDKVQMMRHKDLVLREKHVYIARKNGGDPGLYSVSDFIKRFKHLDIDGACVVYDLDGMIPVGGAESRTIRQQFAEQCIRNTRNIINDIWTSHWTSNESHLKSNLLRIKLLHSNGNISHEYDGLTFNLLRDIYDVHKCFWFANYHFMHYKVNQFAKHIQKCDHFNSSIKKCIKTVGMEARLTITTINLYPSYIIDDDMYQICKYFFCASRIVYDQLNKNHFVLRVCVIPRSVVCIYDNDKGITFN